MKRLQALLLPVFFAAALVLVPGGRSASAAVSIAITSPTNGSSASGSSFTVAGTATADSKISVKVNGSVVGTTTSDNSGNWSLNVTGQATGSKTIEATASRQQMYTNVLNAGNFSASRMSIINTTDNTEDDTFSIFGGGAFPINWKPNPDFTKAYGVAPYLNSGTVWVMDLVNNNLTTTFSLPGAGQRGASIAYNTDGSKVYITDNANTDVIVYDTSDESQIGSAIGIGTSPHSNTHRPNSNQIWIDNSGDNNVSVIDTTTDTVIHTYAVNGQPNGLSFSPDGSLAYIGTNNLGAGGVDILDADTGTIVDSVTGTFVPEYMLVNSAGTKLYFSSPGDDAFQVIDLTDNSLEATISIPNGPWGMDFTADGSQLYVAAPDLLGGLSGTDITIINTADNSIAGTITPGGGAPFFIYAAPQQSASTSITFSLASGQLADTGSNRHALVTGAEILLGLGAVGTLYLLRRRAI